eukprot:1141683-Pelagomonas_calceolata.AAC.2
MASSLDLKTNSDHALEGKERVTQLSQLQVRYLSTRAVATAGPGRGGYSKGTLHDFREKKQPPGRMADNGTGPR